MTRITSRRIRQAVLALGDPLDPNILPEELQLFNDQGEPLMIGTDAGRFQVDNSAGVLASSAQMFDSFEAHPSIRLYKVGTNRPARVRVYPTEEFRLNDANRPIGTRPRGNNGRLLEVVTTPTMLELTLTPVVDLVSKEADVPEFYTTITNLDSVEGEVVITYYYIRTE